MIRRGSRSSVDVGMCACVFVQVGEVKDHGR